MVNKYLKLVFNTSKKKISLKKKIKKINYYEKKYNFYKRLDNGYIKWDYIRLIISRTIGKIDSTFKKDFKNQLTNNFFNNLFYFKNFKIFFSYKKKDIIFFGHNRGTLKNNIIIDEYLDKIVKYFKKKKIIVLSGGHFYYGCRYNYNDNRIFLNYLHLYLKIKSYFILYLNKKELNIVKKKSDKFELIYQSESENWWYCYFKKLNPKYIFFVSINTYLPVVRAANKLNIKTIEIQHGTPNTKKIEYSYNVNPNERLSSPTFFLGWGIFWKRYVNKFYYRKSFINFGKSINNKTILCKNNSSDILFIDQFILGRTIKQSN